MVLGGRDSGRCLGHEGEAPMNGISAFIKEASESLLAPLPCEDTERGYEFGSGATVVNLPAP